MTAPRESSRDGYLADARGSFGRTSRVKNFGQALETLEKQTSGFEHASPERADIHMIPGGANRACSKSLTTNECNQKTWPEVQYTILYCQIMIDRSSRRVVAIFRNRSGYRTKRPVGCEMSFGRMAALEVLPPPVFKTASTTPILQD